MLDIASVDGKLGSFPHEWRGLDLRAVRSNIEFYEGLEYLLIDVEDDVSDAVGSCFEFCIVISSTNVAAQAISPAPRPVTAPAYAPRPSLVPETNYVYNMTWSPIEQKALKDIVQEWSKTNADINSLLTGWSVTDVNPCAHVWEGTLCSIVDSDVTYDNITGINTVLSYVSVIGLSIINTDLVGVLPPAIEPSQETQDFQDQYPKSSRILSM